MRHNSGCLDLFMSRANRHDLLKPEEEILLGKRIQAMVKLRESGKQPANFTFEEKKIWSSGVKAREKMIESNLKLVVHLASKLYRPVSARSGSSGMDKMDLVQEGTIGLATAVDKFNPEKGYRFSTYAYWWIKQGMSRGIQNQERTIRMPDHAHEAIRKAMRFEAKYLTENKVRPTVTQVAEAVGIDKNKLEHYLACNRRTKSLEAKAREDLDGAGSFSEIIADKKGEGDAAMSIGDFDLNGALQFLEPKERDIVCLRYGVFGSEKMTLADIGKKYGISRERVRQIAERAVRRMRLKLAFGGCHQESKVMPAGRQPVAA